MSQQAIARNTGEEPSEWNRNIFTSNRWRCLRNKAEVNASGPRIVTQSNLACSIWRHALPKATWMWAEKHWNGEMVGEGAENTNRMNRKHKQHIKAENQNGIMRKSKTKAGKVETWIWISYSRCDTHKHTPHGLHVSQSRQAWLFQLSPQGSCIRAAIWQGSSPTSPLGCRHTPFFLGRQWVFIHAQVLQHVTSPRSNSWLIQCINGQSIRGVTRTTTKIKR